MKRRNSAPCSPLSYSAQEEEKIQLDPNRVPEILADIELLSLSEQYTVYIALLNKLKQKESKLVEHCQNVHSLDYLKGLLNCKKEVAIDRLCIILPLIKTRDVDAKNLIMKIIPVLFSYSTLYDTEIGKVFKIIEIIQVHPAFTKDQGVFAQWIAIFEKRKLNIDKKFLYKDESYVQNLPKLLVDNYSPFAKVIGYADIGLLRTIHRWLRILRLHKYLYFFAFLNYKEIISINSTNIAYFEKTVGVFDMTVGARNKILREIDELRNRSNRLSAIIQKKRYSPSDLEDAGRDLKKIMRSPISVKMETQLISLIIEALRKVSNTVYTMIGMSEKIIPLYGLTISILKEAYNYSYFDPSQKELFNAWRSELSSKIHTTTSKAISIPIDIPMFNYHDEDFEDDSSFNSQSPIDETEMIAIQMVNFVLT